LPRGGSFSSQAIGGVQDMAAQVAAAKASTDQLLKTMGLKQDTHMGVSKVTQEAQPTREVKVSRELVHHLMTTEHRKLLTEETGAEVEWEPEERMVKFTGSAEQLKQAVRLVARVEMHCHWGASEDKVRRLLRRRPVQSVLCRLAPMTVNKLKVAEKTFGPQEVKMTVGKGRNNNVVIEDALVSRNHCVLSFDVSKGAVYVADLSTNGTFLNGRRLPSKKLGKVLLSHGDELLLKDPNSSGDPEFGYICNLQELSFRSETKLEAPRRILGPEETSLVRSMA